MPDWEWTAVPGEVGYLKRSCCGESDDNPNHHPDCMFSTPSYTMMLPFTPETQTMKRILGGGVLENAIAHFMYRNHEYGDAKSHSELGPSAQFVDISRKVQKLRRYLWDGVAVPPDAENVEVICQELIGHLLLTLDQIREESSD